MKKLTTILTCISLAFMAPAVPAAAIQSAPIAVCVAKSPVAAGWATRYNMYEACRVALTECALRTPSDQVCVVTNRWWEA